MIISNKTKNKLNSYIKLGFICESTAYKLVMAKNREEIIICLSNVLKLNLNLINNIKIMLWEVWYDYENTFNEGEIQIIRCMLFSDGIIDHKIYNPELFKTYYKQKMAMESLINRCIIFDIELTDRTLVYTFTAKFIEDVMKNGKKI